MHNLDLIGLVLFFLVMAGWMIHLENRRVTPNAKRRAVKRQPSATPLDHPTGPKTTKR